VERSTTIKKERRSSLETATKNKPIFLLSFKLEEFESNVQKAKLK
jgi:hypothetical protein